MIETEQATKPLLALDRALGVRVCDGGRDQPATQALVRAGSGYGPSDGPTLWHTSLCEIAPAVMASGGRGISPGVHAVSRSHLLRQ